MTDPATASASLGERVERLGSVGLFFLVAAPLFVVYLATASWSYPVHTDAFTNVLSARALGANGSLHLTEHEELTEPLYHDTVA